MCEYYESEDEDCCMVEPEETLVQEAVSLAWGEFCCGRLHWDNDDGVNNVMKGSLDFLYKINYVN